MVVREVERTAYRSFDGGIGENWPVPTSYLIYVGNGSLAGECGAL